MHAQSLTCIGDCSGAKVVTVGNVITCVNIDLGYTPLAMCTACSTDGMKVQISDLILAVNNVLLGCPGGPTPPPPPPTNTPTNTPNAPTPTATAASVVRVFNIDPGLGQASSPTMSASGLFSTGLSGANAADRISSGPMTLVMGAPDASGMAPLSLQEDTTISVDVTADKTCLCLKLLTDGQSGSISCNGGGSFDTQAERSASQPPADISWVATGGLPSTNAPPGSATLLVKANFENVPDTSGMMGFPCDHIDCATHTYTGQPNPLNTFAFTTTTATAIQDTTGKPIKLPDASVPALNPANYLGQPFDCAHFATPGSGGRFVAPAPASIVILTANNFRFAEKAP
jgi:hypothetical protein